MGRRILALLAAIILCCPALAADKQELDDCEYWRLGADDAEQAKRAAACDRIITSNSYSAAERAFAHAKRADRAEQQNRNEDAIAEFDKALALAPDQVEWRRDRAFLLHFAKQHERAIKDFDQILVATPDDAHVSFYRGLSRLEMGDEGGFADLDKGVALAPGDYWYAYWRALELAKRGRNEAAIADLTKAISLKADNVDSYLLLSEVHKKMGDNEKAIADLTHVTELDPKRTSAYMDRAFLYEATGQVDRAIADYDTLLNLEPDDQYWKERKADVLKKRGARAERTVPAIEPAPDVENAPEPKKSSVETQGGHAVGTDKKGAEQAGKGECRYYLAITNTTIAVPCPE